MRTTLLLSTIAAGLFAASTMAFAQNYGSYPQAVGEGNANATYVAPYDRFTRSDLGYQGNVNAPRSNARLNRAPYAGRGPAPAQLGN